MRMNSMVMQHKNTVPWEITVVDIGEQTLTGGRLKRVRDYVDDSSFCFTYGDGVSNIQINELIKTHKENNKLATVTAVQPPGHYGLLDLDIISSLKGFQENPKGDGAWMIDGFFVLKPVDFIYSRLLGPPGNKNLWRV